MSTSSLEIPIGWRVSTPSVLVAAPTAALPCPARGSTPSSDYRTRADGLHLRLAGRGPDGPTIEVLRCGEITHAGLAAPNRPGWREYRSTPVRTLESPPLARPTRGASAAATATRLRRPRPQDRLPGAVWKHGSSWVRSQPPLRSRSPTPRPGPTQCARRPPRHASRCSGATGPSWRSRWRRRDRSRVLRCLRYEARPASDGGA